MPKPKLKLTKIDKASIELAKSLKKQFESEKYNMFTYTECCEIMAKTSCECIRLMQEEINAEVQTI